MRSSMREIGYRAMGGQVVRGPSGRVVGLVDHPAAVTCAGHPFRGGDSQALAIVSVAPHVDLPSWQSELEIKDAAARAMP